MQLVPTGFNICLWFFWVFVLFLKRILVFVQQKQFTDLLSVFQESFWAFQSSRQILSWGKSSWLHQVSPPLPLITSPPPHHVALADPKPLPNALIQADFVFVHEDASVSALSLLYRGPYKVLECQSKFFRLQVGEKVDVVSVDRLKPVISDSKVTTANPPSRGRPILHPQGPSSDTSTSAPPRVGRKVLFQAQPAVLVRRNPHRTARSYSRNLASAVSLSSLVSGGSPVADRSSYFPP